MASVRRPLVWALVLVSMAAMCAWPTSAGRLGASRAADFADHFLQRRQLQSDCLTCSLLSTCIRATCLFSDGAATNYVALDFSGCKNSSLSWFCCRTSGCSTTTCNGVASTSTSNSTCNNVLNATVALSSSATSVTLQVHDGRLTGNYNCTPATPCCGGDSGACGTGSTSSVCDAVSVPISGLSTGRCPALTCLQVLRPAAFAAATEPGPSVAQAPQPAAAKSPSAALAAAAVPAPSSSVARPSLTTSPSLASSAISAPLAPASLAPAPSTLAGAAVASSPSSIAPSSVASSPSSFTRAAFASSPASLSSSSVSPSALSPSSIASSPSSFAGAAFTSSPSTVAPASLSPATLAPASLTPAPSSFAEAAVASSPSSLAGAAISSSALAPSSASCASSCPNGSQILAAGFNTTCGATCLLSQPSACLIEPRPSAFDSPGSYLPVLSGVYGCYLKASGTYTSNSSGTPTTYPLYRAYDGTTNLDTFFAAAVPGAVAALPCYNDSSLTARSPYLLVSVLPTPSDNYACLSCAFYNVAPLALTASAGCDCNDTAWAFPTPAQFGAAYDSTSTAEIRLNVTDPGFGNGVFWNPRQQTAGAWGGYFRILPPTAAAGTSAVLSLAVCAGCGLNQPDKGYYLGTGFTITFTNYTEGYGSINIKALPYGATAEVDRLQVYLTFVPPPNLNPGQFQSFTATSPTVTPTSPVTAFPAGPFTATALDNVTYTWNGTTTTVPNTVDPSQGLFLALHMDVGQACPAPY
ncbi:hypothetical protein HYH02_007582 [Chlamydomonas schloesseri]|uniref:Pherophorin domain-containing protein n=1 Tax=Chlamydomonas schloesseri TaxID=2026947 RepID=A0A836B4R4_9CHLO|nr:hypothetical protein HYH02_007582 [Chlamydomonas schloesseri]|eukprot:KAG2447666.1 hypothetical protein HYH02_007582 [Chlamydomonas schloesseri]